MLYIRAAFQEPIEGLFDYRVPEELSGHVAPGVRVTVPRRNSVTTAYVIEVTDTPEFPNPRPLFDILDTEPLLTPSMLELGKWMAGYYLCPLGWTLRSMLPGGINVQGAQEVVATPHFKARETEIFEESWTPWERTFLGLLGRKEAWPLAELHQRFPKEHLFLTLRKLECNGYLVLQGNVEEAKVHTLKRTAIRLTEEGVRAPFDHPLLARAPRLRDFLERLKQEDEWTFLADLRPGFASATDYGKKLAEAGLAEVLEREIQRNPFHSPPPPYKAPPHLNPGQEAVIRTVEKDVDKGQFKVHLCFGVTGSGKTEVYLHIIAHALEQGKNACVLVPEISLTPQAVQRYRGRFGDVVAVMHSRLTPGERFDTFRALLKGQYRVVIGPRSAIFAPLENLGVIVVDEEHDTSYKQDTSPNYHGRDVAIWRARQQHCPVVLGSATPSLESFHNAQAGKYLLHSLPVRAISQPMPEVEVIDMRAEYPTGQVEGFLSAPIQQAIRENQAQGHQTLIYLNRRGYHNFGYCRACGHVFCCPHCSVTLTFHQAGNYLKCHHCGYQSHPERRCPACQSEKVTYKGLGTQKIEETLRELFKEASVARMDSDTMRGKRSHDQMMERLESGQVEMVIGTRMVTKGHDVHGITLVAVLSADSDLHFPDFRAAERTFQNLAQVSGRAGRGVHPGRVLVQTFQPEHYAIQCARTHDYSTFAERELEFRKKLGYPPFSRMVALEFRGLDEQLVLASAHQVADAIDANRKPEIHMKGPAPAPLTKINNRFRYHVILVGPNGADLRWLARSAMDLELKRGVELRVDVDPQNLL